ncbi:MAG: HPr family phosphocarrier protein [Clostridia bacterium]
MNTFHVTLSSINDVKQFVNAACSQMCEIDLISGRYIIDAKSIMGIFSIDLAKPIKVQVHGTDEDAKAFKNAVKNFITD